MASTSTAKSLAQKYIASPGVKRPGTGTQFTASDTGVKGVFDLGDAANLKKQGLSNDEIKWWASKNQLQVGPAAAAQYGIAGKLEGSTNPSSESFNYTDPGDKDAFGLADYNELSGQGVSEDVMRFLASGRGRTGDIVNRLLGTESQDVKDEGIRKAGDRLKHAGSVGYGYTHSVLKPEETKAPALGKYGNWTPDNVFKDKGLYDHELGGQSRKRGVYFDSDKGDKGVFGQKDYEDLKSQGMDDDQIRYYASRQEKVGPKMAKKFALSGKLYDEYGGSERYQGGGASHPWRVTPRTWGGTFSSEANPAYSKSPTSSPAYSYTDPGDIGAFGMKDVEELKHQGVGDDVMRFIAAGHGEGKIGGKARRYLGI